MANLSLTPPNTSSIEVCDRLGKTFLMSIVSNHLRLALSALRLALSATDRLRVNLTQDYNLFFVPA